MDDLKPSYTFLNEIGQNIYNALDKAIDNIPNLVLWEAIIDEAKSGGLLAGETTDIAFLVRMIEDRADDLYGEVVGKELYEVVKKIVYRRVLEGFGEHYKDILDQPNVL